MHTRLILGCDFTSRPSRRKPIVCAWADLRGDTLYVRGFERCEDMTQFAAILARPHWVGGFDLPFGLPRELVTALNWPQDWSACMAHYASMSRAEIRTTFKAFCDARPVGSKFAHRATDRPAASSPSMKWVNPPVAYMLHAGVPALLAAGVSFAGLQAGDSSRVALEAYPAFAARPLIANASYKSDDTTRQKDPLRSAARAALVAGLCHAMHPQVGLRVEATPDVQAAMLQDASGDTVDAVLCALQAAWACGQPDWGLPRDMDGLEGWICSVPASTPTSASTSASTRA